MGIRVADPAVHPCTKFRMGCGVNWGGSNTGSVRPGTRWLVCWHGKVGDGGCYRLGVLHCTAYGRDWISLRRELGGAEKVTLDNTYRGHLTRGVLENLAPKL